MAKWVWTSDCLVKHLKQGSSRYLKNIKKPNRKKKKIKPPQKSTLCISATKLMFFLFFTWFFLFCFVCFCFVTITSLLFVHVKKKKKNTWTKYVNKITGTVPDDCILSIYFWTCLSYFEQRWYFGRVGVGSLWWWSYFWFVSLHLLHSFDPL